MDLVTQAKDIVLQRGFTARGVSEGFGIFYQDSELLLALLAFCLFAWQSASQRTLTDNDQLPSTPTWHPFIIILAMQCTLMSGVQCLRAPSTTALKQSTSMRLPASSSLMANPLRTQQPCRQMHLRRGTHIAVQAAAADTATFYDYAVKVRSAS